ncbi:EAL domain-containing protein [uncultured Roseibium sp.]|uniref:sensor domain-containing phosphodiesterase n=1 Tax=uncultured Roseibium sp. TaxID=1936171 RepID=UPI0025939214|nr:EAL domain-containing protein [uncultured Roseibium sp.]
MGAGSYPLPENEAGRLTSLRALDILRTPKDPEFDAITELASSILECPIALVSLVEEQQQWFKSCVGVSVESTPRDVSFCSHAIATGKPMVVPDTQKDPRFADNPQVTGEPHIRFYAGYPLSIDQVHYLGTLCVMDDKPRQPTEFQLKQLERLALVVEGLLRSYKTMALAKQSSILAHAQNAKVASQHKLLKQIESLAKIGAWRLDRNTNVLTWSDQVYRLHDLPIGTPLDLEMALSFYPESARAEVEAIISQSIEIGAPFLVETDFFTNTGRQRRVRFMGELEDAGTDEEMLIGVIQDITEQYEQEQVLWQAAHVDSLSGLGNRHWFQSELEEMMKGCGGAPREHALILIDLDGFKLANDSLGHLAGDEVIRVVAQRIRKISGEGSFCARVGGDEFAVIVPLSGPETPAETANKLISRIKEPVPFEGTSVYVSASIGVAFAPQDASTAEDLMKCADMALYRVKRSGRGRVGYYEKTLRQVFDSRQKAIDVVRSAHRSRRLKAHYQPIVDLSDMSIKGAEALVRVSEPNGSLLGPDDFWDAFKDPESARVVDSRVFQIVLENLKNWQNQGFTPGRISINASKYWFQTDDFASGFLSQLSECSIPPDMIRLEVTENVLLNDEIECVHRILSNLREAGVSITLDDFGAGFASLTHLRDYPIDAIKIDRSFIKALSLSHQNTLIVRSIVDLSKSFNLTVIAAGVESYAEARFLQSIGCDQAQGSLFSDAVDAAELQKALADQQSIAAPVSYVI